MDVLDLTNNIENGISYEISKFPDGQQNLKISTYSNVNSVLIKSRLNNFLDLELIICADQQNWEQEKSGLLKTVFLNGKLVKKVTLEEIRNRLNETKTN